MHPFQYGRDGMEVEVSGSRVSDKARIQSGLDAKLFSSLVMYTHIYPDIHTSTLYVAGFAKSVRSYTLHVTTLDFTTGEVIASVNIPASITNALTDFLLLAPSRAGSSSATNEASDKADVSGPSLVWLSPSTTASDAPLSLLSAPLSPALKGKVLTIPNASYKRIQDVDLADRGLFMAFPDDGSAQVLGYETGGSPVSVMWDFGDVVSRIALMRFRSILKRIQAPSSHTSGSHFFGALNGDGKPSIGKAAWSNVHDVSSVHLSQAHSNRPNQT